MTKVRIPLVGWEYFNGQLGGVQFKDGVSVRELTDLEIARIGANMRIEAVGTGEQVGIGVTIVEGMRLAAEVVPAKKTVEQEDKDKADEEAKVEVTEATEAKKKYTKDELEEIASEKGIKGIREVATLYGVKGVQIHQLIDEILLAQED